VPSQSVSDAPLRWYAHRYNRSGYYRLAGLSAGLPRPVRVRLAAGVARLVGPRFVAERAAVRRNLARVHPERDAAWLERRVDRVFERFAICFADLLSLNRRPGDPSRRHVVGVDEQDPTREALARGRGCVSLTAHLGNWDLAGRVLAPLGRTVHVVMAPEVDPGVAEVLRPRSDGRVRFVRLDNPVASVQLVSALRRGEIVAFQMDRVIGGRGDRRVSLFGAPAWLPIGPFVIAAAAGAPVVPAFCVLDSGWTYRLCVEPAFEVARGAEADGLVHAAAILERYVSAYSDQWFNFFDVWGPPPEPMGETSACLGALRGSLDAG